MQVSEQQFETFVKLEREPAAVGGGHTALQPHRREI